jgi:hypothetical protein
MKRHQLSTHAMADSALEASHKRFHIMPVVPLTEAGNSVGKQACGGTKEWYSGLRMHKRVVESVRVQTSNSSFLSFSRHSKQGY